MALKIDNLTKRYDEAVVYSDFTLAFNEGIITCILGPSGCGKTTLLNIIGGIIAPDSGSLSGFEGMVMSYIFQDPRLLPWKTVGGNIDFVINRTIPPAEREKKVERFIRLVELDGYTDHYPSQLSGGMRQRVSISRAFACPSDIILMDEPLKGLDIALKQNLIRSFSRIWKADRRTVIFVTHDVDEALMLGEEIIVLSRSPVRITAHESFTEPVGSRERGSKRYGELKQVMISALGQQP